MTFAAERDSLLERLQVAMELELATIPPYMMALVSLKEGKNRAAADLIRSVMMEEMLHMALIANVVFSLGGRTHLGEENIPSFPAKMRFKGVTFSDREFEVNLAGFSKAQLETFLKIELPAGLAEAFGVTMETIEVPAPSIGDFYLDLAKDLRRLVEGYPGEQVFVGEPARQIGPGQFWGAAGRPRPIKSLEDALWAFELIMRQGEGASFDEAASDGQYFADPANRGHYFRFMEILHGRRYQSDDKPQGKPTGQPIMVDFYGAYPIGSNLRQSAYVDGSELFKLNLSFNRHYSVMLNQLEQAFNGQPLLLYESITHGMHGLAGLAQEMVRLPVPGQAGVHGCPTFEWIDIGS